MPLIRVDHVVKEFRSPKRQPGVLGSLRTLFTREETVTRAVDDISFSLEEGELLGYIGPNGAGKSTTPVSCQQHQEPMRTTNFAAYLQIVSLLTQTAFAYRVELFVQLVGLLLKIFLLRVVWTAVYAGRAAVDGVPLAEVISFMTLANLQLFLLASWITGYLHDRIRQGLIALDLARPVPFLGQLMAHQVGGTVGLAPFVLLAAPFALLVGGLQPPASATAAAVYVVSLLLAYLVSAMISMLIGLVAFWTTEIWGIRTIVDFIAQFFSGALVPLWFFPPVLRDLASWLPFQAQAFLPLSIYLGQLQGTAVLGALGIQLFWFVALALVVALVWRRAMRRVVVQGG